MAKIQFPANPILNSTFVASNGVTYTYDGEKWNASRGVNFGLGSNPGVTPPGNPAEGTFWWDSVTGQLFTYYIDVDGGQWIEASTEHGNFVD